MFTYIYTPAEGEASEGRQLSQGAESDRVAFKSLVGDGLAAVISLFVIAQNQRKMCVCVSND